MVYRLATVVLATACLSGASSAAVEAEAAIADFTDSRPGTRLDWHEGRIARIYGHAFATGPSPLHSARSFVDRHAGMFGVPPEDLAETGPFADGRHMQPIMYRPATGTWKFTGCFYTQVRDGIPVFGGRLTLLCRNEPDHPVVLAAADLRGLGAFRPDPAAARIDPARLDAFARAALGDRAVIRAAQPVIFAGIDDAAHPPVLAFSIDVAIDHDRRRLVVDATTGVVLHEASRVHFGVVNGAVSGMTTPGPASAECSDEVLTPLPYVRVVAGGASVLTDADGLYSITPTRTGLATVSAALDGAWFEVLDFTGGDPVASVEVTPPAQADLGFNLANVDEFERAAVNAYLDMNVVRDFVVGFNPAYPTLTDGVFPVWVNRTDGFCPGSAWYDAVDASISFCAAGVSDPNTSWSSIVYHEYGHHLVAAAGSGQGQYGEGMGDVMSILILDEPRVGVGWDVACDSVLRDADNGLLYPCNGEDHACGALLSGCVWSTRNELLVTNPTGYRDILGNLAVNAMLLHNGSNITPQITIDYLTLDDDNGDILDGTPHYPEIQAGFSAHNMPGPEVMLVAFEAPGGIPTQVSPSGKDVFSLEVVAVTQTPAAGTATLAVSGTGAPGSYTTSPLSQSAPNVYDVRLPSGNCGEQAFFYFTVQTESGAQVQYPADGPDTPLAAVYATTSMPTFSDDGERDIGWAVTDDIDLIDGTWERGAPIGGGDRGDPPTDADGSGQCYLTDNEDGNSDVDGGATTLTSPVMDATRDTPYISYWRWYSNSETPQIDDVLVVEVTDGTGWVELETVGPFGSGTTGGWFFRQFRIEDYVAATDQFRIRFIASDTGAGSIVEAAVDGISLDAFSCSGEACLADVTGDGRVNVSDLVAVIVAWGAVGADAADVNGDFVVDVSDLVYVIEAWGDCP